MEKPDTDFDAEALARAHTPLAIGTLVDVLQPRTLVNAHGVEELVYAEAKDRIRAAEALLDRGHGKPSQAIIEVPANRRKRDTLSALSMAQLMEQAEPARLLPAPEATPLPTGSTSSVTPPPILNGHGPAIEIYAGAPDGPDSEPHAQTQRTNDPLFA